MEYLTHSASKKMSCYVNDDSIDDDDEDGDGDDDDATLIFIVWPNRKKNIFFDINICLMEKE